MVSLSSFLLSLGGIIIVDLILSGDNALVIGVVASHIEERRARLLALIFGGLLAIFLRIVFTIFATFIIGFSYLQAIGAVFILIIAIRLILDSWNEKEQNNKEKSIDETKILTPIKWLYRWSGLKAKLNLAPQRKNLLLTILMITFADITMSLDNVIAIAGLAHQQVLIVVLGLLLSITLLLVSSGLIAELISRYSWLISFTVVILSCVAGDLIWRNIYLWPFIHNQLIYRIVLYIVLILIVFFAAFLCRGRTRARKTSFEGIVYKKPAKSGPGVRPN